MSKLPPSVVVHTGRAVGLLLGLSAWCQIALAGDLVVNSTGAAVTVVRGDTIVGSEKGSLVFRRSLYAVEDIRAGEPFSRANIRSIRPGYGLPPKHLAEIVGRTARRDIARGEPLAWSLIA